MFNDYNFLYVEDDPLSREIMKMMMENLMGVSRLTLFEDSQQFLPRLQQIEKHPTVFLLDIHVRPYDGFEMLNILRQHPEFAESYVIALTASVMNEEVDRLRTSGFDGAIAKPLSVHTFPNLIERVLSGESVWHIMEG